MVLPHFGRKNKLPVSDFMVEPMYSGCKSAVDRERARLCTQAVSSVLMGGSKLSPWPHWVLGGSVVEGKLCVSSSTSQSVPLPAHQCCADASVHHLFLFQPFSEEENVICCSLCILSAQVLGRFHIYKCMFY